MLNFSLVCPLRRSKTKHLEKYLVSNRHIFNKKAIFVIMPLGRHTSQKAFHNIKNMPTPDIRACIFDLDGVIVDTAKYHYAAWRHLANSLGFDFSEEQNEQLKGVGRMESLRIILELGGVNRTEEEQLELAAEKNDHYLQLISGMSSNEVLSGVREFLEELRAAGILIGLGSASKNAPNILDKVGLTPYFGTIIDGNQTTKGKPHPQVFLLGAEALGVAPENCLVFEDAPKGVDAALSGNMYAIGVGDSRVLGHAHHVIPSFEGLTMEVFGEL
jgi:beta-phosphoglucomutase